MDLNSHRALWDGVKGVRAYDIGCSYGDSLAELTFLFKYVLGFEPSALAFNYLTTVAAVEGVKAINLAISDHDGVVTLDLEEGITEVYCRSLDSLTQDLDYPDFIHVSCPDHESQILKGAEFLMTVSPPSWIIEIFSEVSGGLVMATLSKYGYDCDLIVDPDDTYPTNHAWIKAMV